MQHRQFTFSPRILFLLISLYFYWGMLPLLNYLLVPLLKAHYKLTYFRALLVQMSFFASNLLLAIPIARLLNYLGYKMTIVSGLFVILLGAACFIVGAHLQSYGCILFSMFILGAGVVALQVSVNPLMEQIGEKSYSYARLSLGHGFTAMGYALVPFMFSGNIQMSQMMMAYGIVMMVMLVSLQWTRRTDFDSDISINLRPKRGRLSLAFLCRSRLFVFCVLGLFLFVGAEVSIGSLLISFLNLPSIVGLPIGQGAFYLGLYWGGAMFGRLSYVRILMHKPPGFILSIHAIANLALLLVAALGAGRIAMWSLIAVGAFNSIMFPILFAAALSCFSQIEEKNAASSYLVMATSGGALIPVFQGWLADHWGLQNSFLGLLPSYCCVLFVGIIISLSNYKKATL